MNIKMILARSWLVLVSLAFIAGLIYICILYPVGAVALGILLAIVITLVAAMYIADNY